MYAAWSPHGGGSESIARGGERERLVDAFTKVAAERGYEATGVEEVVAEAGLSPADFELQFRDMRQCLLAAYDRFLDCLITEVEDAMDAGAPWPRQVEAGVDAAVGFVVESAGVARLFAVEALAIGPLAIDRYTVAIERIVALLRLGRRRSQEAAALPALTEAVLVAGAVSMVSAALLAEEEASLPELRSQLVKVLLLPYSDAGETPERAP